MAATTKTLWIGLRDQAIIRLSKLQERAKTTTLEGSSVTQIEIMELLSAINKYEWKIKILEVQEQRYGTE